MSKEIINRVSNSNLITIDLGDYKPNQSIIELDVKDFLFKKLVLKEKEFRATLKEFDFSIYHGKTVALHCSTDAILPMWAFMLIASFVNPIAEVHYGTKEKTYINLFLKNIETINPLKFQNKKVIVKGCSDISVHESLYVAITKKLQNHASSLMFGEACSAVPVFKKNKGK